MIICPSCGSIHPEGTTTCPICGSSMTKPMAPPPPAPPSPPVTPTPPAKRTTRVRPASRALFIFGETLRRMLRVFLKSLSVAAFALAVVAFIALMGLELAAHVRGYSPGWPAMARLRIFLFVQVDPHYILYRLSGVWHVIRHMLDVARTYVPQTPVPGLKSTLTDVFRYVFQDDRAVTLCGMAFMAMGFICALTRTVRLLQRSVPSRFAGLAVRMLSRMCLALYVADYLLGDYTRVNLNSYAVQYMLIVRFAVAAVYALALLMLSVIACGAEGLRRRSGRAARIYGRRDTRRLLCHALLTALLSLALLSVKWP